MIGLRFRRKYFEKRDKKAIEIKKAPDNGKEDSYERLGPQACFAAQPPLCGGS
jgi:hypothetical protein